MQDIMAARLFPGLLRLVFGKVTASYELKLWPKHAYRTDSRRGSKGALGSQRGPGHSAHQPKDSVTQGCIPSVYRYYRFYGEPQ